MVTLVLLGLLFLPFLIFGGITSINWKRKLRAVRRWTSISYLIAAGVLLLGVGPYFAAWSPRGEECDPALHPRPVPQPCGHAVAGYGRLQSRLWSAAVRFALSWRE